MIISKAQGVHDRSNAIVVSFAHKHLALIKEDRIRAAIRKRIPTSGSPEWLYFYVNAPASYIAGRARLTNCCHVDLLRALGSFDQLQLKDSEIRKYVGTAANIGMYEFGSIENAHSLVTLPELREHAVFNPPQSFLYLSDEGKGCFDRLLFTKSDKAKGSQK